MSISDFLSIFYARDYLNLSYILKNINLGYSIVKDSSSDLGVNFKIVQIRPTVKAVSTKTSKNFFCIFVVPSRLKSESKN